MWIPSTAVPLPGAVSNYRSDKVGDVHTDAGSGSGRGCCGSGSGSGSAVGTFTGSSSGSTMMVRSGSPIFNAYSLGGGKTNSYSQSPGLSRRMTRSSQRSNGMSFWAKSGEGRDQVANAVRCSAEWLFIIPAIDWIQGWVQCEGQFLSKRGLSRARSTKVLMAHNPKLSLFTGLLSLRNPRALGDRPEYICGLYSFAPTP